MEPISQQNEEEKTIQMSSATDNDFIKAATLMETEIQRPEENDVTMSSDPTNVPTVPLSPAEQARREKLKAQGRISARKSRAKARAAKEALLRSNVELQQRKVFLNMELQRLRDERTTLYQLLLGRSSQLCKMIDDIKKGNPTRFTGNPFAESSLQQARSRLHLKGGSTFPVIQHSGSNRSENCSTSIATSPPHRPPAAQDPYHYSYYPYPPPFPPAYYHPPFEVPGYASRLSSSDSKIEPTSSLADEDEKGSVSSSTSDPPADVKKSRSGPPYLFPHPHMYGHYPPYPPYYPPPPPYWHYPPYPPPPHHPAQFPFHEPSQQYPKLPRPTPKRKPVLASSSSEMEEDDISSSNTSRSQSSRSLLIVPHHLATTPSSSFTSDLKSSKKRSVKAEPDPEWELKVQSPESSTSSDNSQT